MKDLGTWGEDRAVQYLTERGYRVLERNYRVLEGEIDVVVERERRVIFVEVKTRTTDRFGSPEESLNDRKQDRLYQAGLQYLQSRQLMEHEFQFDLIAIECTTRRRVRRISHYEDVIGGRPWD